MNSLNEVYKLYCPSSGQGLNKSTRDIFVNGSLKDVRSDFQNLMTYCGNDVMATTQVFRNVFPLFRSRCPHPVTLSGMLTMSVTYLPVTPSWHQYIQQSDDVSDELEHETELLIARQAKEACQLLVTDQYKDDIWLWDLDWNVSKLKIKKEASKKNETFAPKINANDNELVRLEKEFLPILKTSKLLYKNQPRCPGYPKWYNDLCDKYSYSVTPEPTDLGPAKSIVPKLLRLTWMGFPLYKDSSLKWGFLTPHKDIEVYLDLGHDLEHDQVFPLEAFHSLMKKDQKIKDQDTDPAFIDEPPDYVKVKGWVGKKKVKPPISKLGYELDQIPGCIFSQLPHKDGKGLAVGSPLSKHFLDMIMSGVLSTASSDKEDNLAEKVLTSSKMLSYWRSNRNRIRDQIVVKTSTPNGGSMMAILPQIVTSGTLTRRAVEKTWLTASNAKEDRVGSELKAMVMAPEDHLFVGADVDSQELWIAAVIGDAHFTGEHGSTALGWMTLQGNKNDGTDLHSVTAKSVGVTRNEAKILNYGRIYGAGVRFAKQLLQNFNPKLSDQRSGELAEKMYKETKGERMFILNSLGAFCHFFTLNKNNKVEDYKSLDGTPVSKAEMSRCVTTKRKLDQYLSSYDLKEDKYILNDTGKATIDLVGLFYQDDGNISLGTLKTFVESIGGFKAQSDFEEFVRIRGDLSARVIWSGGSESETFNKLEEIAMTGQAKTPVLGCRITRALDSRVVGSNYLPSRINWVVQSSAVDYLHLLLSAMTWLFEEFDIQGRFVISIHDEVRYLVKKEDVYRAGMALQVSNLLVRAMFCSRLGMNSMPLDVAYFSGVDIDQVMRKEPRADCVTPSNPQGLEHGYGIGFGECLTIKDLINKTQGSLKKKI